jgi:hypothetical protein
MGDFGAEWMVGDDEEGARVEWDKLSRLRQMYECAVTRCERFEDVSESRSKSAKESRGRRDECETSAEQAECNTGERKKLSRKSRKRPLERANHKDAEQENRKWLSISSSSLYLYLPLQALLTPCSHPALPYPSSSSPGRGPSRSRGGRRYRGQESESRRGV